VFGKSRVRREWIRGVVLLMGLIFSEDPQGWGFDDEVLLFILDYFDEVTNG